MVIERELFSRKTISGWGDDLENQTNHLRVDELSNRVDFLLQDVNRDKLVQIIKIILEGLYLNEQVIIQRKYSINSEDVTFVYESLNNVCFRRASKKLTQIRKEALDGSADRLDDLSADTFLMITADLIDYLICFFSDLIFKSFEKKITGLVRNYSRKLPGFIKDSEFDDLYSIAQMEFVQTIRAWDPSYNPMVWPFAYSRINGAMRDYIRYLTKADPSRVYNWINDAAHLFISVNKNKEEFAGSIENGVTLQQAMEQINPIERKVVTMKSMNDLTLSEIGKQINLSESQVSRIYSGAITKLRKILSA